MLESIIKKTVFKTIYLINCNAENFPADTKTMITLFCWSLKICWNKTTGDKLVFHSYAEDFIFIFICPFIDTLITFICNARFSIRYNFYWNCVWLFIGIMFNMHLWLFHDHRHFLFYNLQNFYLLCILTIHLWLISFICKWM